MDYEKMTIAQLKEECKKQNIAIPATIKKKNEYINLLKVHIHKQQKRDYKSMSEEEKIEARKARFGVPEEQKKIEERKKKFGLTSGVIEYQFSEQKKIEERKKKYGSKNNIYNTGNNK
ncbi:hypothetical protein TCON_2552 [Astathelohania contejeani]|uniref:SAP domain-containing protein n=1 Tax=Astathelohania contejeani TaxID=164912 RepID=A0ABQ7HVN7_9MICR|nr:hypothetical protein TCON_2552 [Thelohania contejeani]